MIPRLDPMPRFLVPLERMEDSVEVSLLEDAVTFPKNVSDDGEHREFDEEQDADCNGELGADAVAENVERVGFLWKGYITLIGIGPPLCPAVAAIEDADRRVSQSGDSSTAKSNVFNESEPEDPLMRISCLLVSARSYLSEKTLLLNFTHLPLLIYRCSVGTST